MNALYDLTPMVARRLRLEVEIDEARKLLDEVLASIERREQAVAELREAEDAIWRAYAKEAAK